MPELPEMEHYRRLLIPRTAGRNITEAVVTREKTINVDPAFFKAIVEGKRMTDIERRAKYLLFHLEEDVVLLLHLMLGGWMFWGTEEEKPDRTVQVSLSFGQETLYFINLRLGYLHLYRNSEAEALLEKLGPDPLGPGFGEAEFAARLAGKSRGVIKTVLVDQSFLSGIGNCYSDEICFAAGVLPERKVGSLNPGETGRLFRAMQSVLTEAVEAGGYMEPFYQGDTVTGGFNDRCRIYDREGQPCLRCGTTIVRRDIGSRKSYCCTGCQH